MIGFDSIEFASLSDVGVRRSHNQDSFATFPATDQEQWQQRGHVFLVADGMGAHAVGELASKLAADSIPHIYAKHSQEGPVSALRKSFAEANLTIHMRGQQNREFEGMGTTATALVVRPEGAWIGHVGDSRAYRVRAGKIEQLSFDHSLLWELARRQRKDPEKMTGVPSNVIIRSLGPESLVQVDVEGPHPLQPGDQFVLCSDGLSGPVRDREIGAVVSALPPAEACRFLISLANFQGGPDNITAIVIRVGGSTDAATDPPDSDLEREQPPRRWLIRTLLDWVPWPFLFLLLGILLAVGAIYLTYHELPGGMPSFVLAGTALLVGLVGLMIQNLAENKQDEPEVYKPRRKIYRQTTCGIEPGFVQKLAQAGATLEEQIREKNWHADWSAWQRHLDQGRRALAQDDLAGAFREHCRAMQILMDAVHQQRGKEEAFKPLWDRAPA